MYKLTDILEHIWQVIKLGCANHLFLLTFVFFVIFLGTLGIWYAPAFGSSQKPFYDFFDQVGMLTYCAPLLSVTIFDASLRAILNFQKKDDSDGIDLYVWGIFFTIVLVSLVAIFIAKAPMNTFSWWSLAAGMLSLFYWFVVNASNDSYKKPVNNSSPTGGELENSSMLLNGKDSI